MKAVWFYMGRKPGIWKQIIRLRAFPESVCVASAWVAMWLCLSCWIHVMWLYLLQCWHVSQCAPSHIIMFVKYVFFVRLQVCLCELTHWGRFIFILATVQNYSEVDLLEALRNACHCSFSTFFFKLQFKFNSFTTIHVHLGLSEMSPEQH